MNFVEDCVHELLRRKKRLSNKKLSYCVTVDALVDKGFDGVYGELNGESCLGRDWTALASELLKPRPTCATIESLSQSRSAARELLKMWVSQQSDHDKTFDLLIETMLKCKLYSACDELLDFIETFEGNFDAIVSSDEIANAPKVDIDEEDVGNCTSLAVLKRPAAFDEIVSRDVSEGNNCTAIVVLPDQQQQQQQQQQQSPALADQQQNQVVHTDRQSRNGRQLLTTRSVSCPATIGGWLWKRMRRLFRSRSDPGRRSPSPTPIIREPSPPPPPQDEIFVVSSDPDSQTKTMQDLLLFINRMEPVTRQTLTVKTIHDVNQNGLVTTTWLEERVNRAKFVILCFSSIMKAITESKEDMADNHQINYNIKFTMDFLVTGRIYESLCRNPKGKFVPVLLHGDGINTIIIPLRFFKSFSWPEEKKQFSSYIMEQPERQVPHIGTRKPLVRKEFAA